MKALYKRELRSYFYSMIGYVFIAALIAFIGYYFMIVNLVSGGPSFVYTLAYSLSILVIALPILTMKCFSEERKNKTDQLLLTSPVSVFSIVMAKYLSLLTVFAIPLAIFCVCPLLIASFGNNYLLGDYLGIISLFFMGSMLISIGMFVSTLTENQLISAIISFAVMLVLFMWNSIVSYIPNTSVASLVGLFVVLAALLLIIYSMTKNKLLTIIVGVAGTAVLVVLYLLNPNMFYSLIPNVLGSFSLTTPFYNYAMYYIFDLGGIILYISVSALFVFLSMQMIQKRRWS